MNQSKLGSLIEAFMNVLVGFGINWCANMYILPKFGFLVTGTQALWIGVAFTAISVARSYVIRRWFNRYLHRLANALARNAKA